MAFNMKGSELYGKLKLNRNMDDSSKPDGRAKSSAFQKNGKSYWQRAKDYANKKREQFKDATVNLSNVVGSSKKEITARRAVEKRTQDERAKITKLRKNISDDREATTKHYKQYVEDNPQQDNDRDKKAKAYAKSQIKENKETKARNLASKSPKTKEESSKTSKGLLAQNITKSKKDKV
tara:strand:- start:2596 stop:3132 length:537 start_codon:yes stop_codon:yes gene_type:complete